MIRFIIGVLIALISSAVIVLLWDEPARAGLEPIQTPRPTQVAGLTCGFKPFKPLSCRNGTAMCICNDYGQCQWLWVGC